MSTWILRHCDAKEAPALLDFWRQAEATPSVTDTLDDVQRMINTATVLVAEADATIVGSIFGVFDGWRANIDRETCIHPFDALRRPFADWREAQPGTRG
jgi:hypothetical protein